jgi:hypothetical protein
MGAAIPPTAVDATVTARSSKDIDDITMQHQKDEDTTSTTAPAAPVEALPPPVLNSTKTADAPTTATTNKRSRRSRGGGLDDENDAATVTRLSTESQYPKREVSFSRDYNILALLLRTTPNSTTTALNTLLTRYDHDGYTFFADAGPPPEDRQVRI